MNAGMLRTIYILTAKLVNVGLYLISRRSLNKIQKLPPKYCRNLLCISIAIYLAMSLLLNLVVNEAIFNAQIIAIISWILILLCMLLILLVIVAISNYQKERQNYDLLQTANQLMTQNYQQLHLDKQAYAKQLHDFKHHLLVLRSLISSGKEEESESYVNSLLSTAYHDVSLCHSGNDIIDAIINCKIAEAKREGIKFTFNVDFNKETNIEAVDICGILANQIDNAFDACRKIPLPASRIVRVDIKQIENFAFFRVENTVVQNPFEHNKELISTKTDSSPLHGLGLKNIRDIVAKYDGTLRNEYQEGHFISVASLCFDLFNTYNSTI